MEINQMNSISVKKLVLRTLTEAEARDVAGATYVQVGPPTPVPAPSPSPSPSPTPKPKEEN